MFKLTKKCSLYAAGFVCYLMGVTATLLKRWSDRMYWQIRRGFRDLESK